MRVLMIVLSKRTFCGGARLGGSVAITADWDWGGVAGRRSLGTGN